MRVTRIDVEGAQGKKAAVRREGDKVVIELPGSPGQVWTYEAAADDGAEQGRLARMLQQKLDGCRGTEGDVAAYLRIIQMLGD
jgi:hypothetical protein